MERSVQIADRIDTERKILYKYYLENDFVVSPEGILKVLATVVCSVSAISFAWGDWCGAGVAAGAAGLAAGAALAALCGALVFAARAPMTCFITVGVMLAKTDKRKLNYYCSSTRIVPTLLWDNVGFTTRFQDIILSTVIGVSLLLVTILSFTLCEIRGAVDYAHGPLALISSILVIGSIVTTYLSVSKKWDAEPRTRTNFDNPTTNELEV